MTTCIQPAFYQRGSHELSVKKPFRPIDRPSETFVPRDHIVHVVDDDAAVCRQLGVILRGAGYAFRTYGSAALFLAQPAADQQGCIVIKVDNPGRDGLEFQRLLKLLSVSLPVIVVTSHADVSLAVAAFKAGVFDFIEKSADASKFLAAVAAALAWHDRGAGRHAEIELIQNHLRILSDREREVLDGLLAGRPNKTIARDLGVSPRTIEVYRAKLMLKMQATTLSGLVRMCLLSAGEVRAPSGENRRADVIPSGARDL